MIIVSIGEKAMFGYDKLLTEKCLYERFKTKDKYNEKLYDEVMYLDCFSSSEFDNNRHYDEQELRYSRRIFIKNEFEPNPEDRVFGKEIVQIKPVKGLLTSKPIGWELYI